VEQAKPCAALEEIVMATSYAAFVSPVNSWAFTIQLPAARLALAGVDWDRRAGEPPRRGRVAPARDLPAEFSFGPFRLLPGSRTLLRDGQPVECGSRAFDLLHVLLLSRGQVVSKDEIVRHVWPTTCVDESNLRFQMASLRKVLGAYRDCIKTIPGRGYLMASQSQATEQAAG
jgi:DNA-binding winged helix-turn-helix (wHTH) protein